MNSDFRHDRARILAASLESAYGSEEQRATGAFCQILQREPAATEAERMIALVNDLNANSTNQPAASPQTAAKNAGPGPKTAGTGTKNGGTTAKAATGGKAVEHPSTGWTAACQALLMSAEFRYVP